MSVKGVGGVGGVRGGAGDTPRREDGVRGGLSKVWGPLPLLPPISLPPRDMPILEGERVVGWQHFLSPLIPTLSLSFSHVHSQCDDVFRIGLFPLNHNVAKCVSDVLSYFAFRCKMDNMCHI